MAGPLAPGDSAQEMLDLCRARVNDPRVRYVQADLFEWEPDRTYDVCFFGSGSRTFPSEIKTTLEFFIYGHTTPDLR